MNIIKTLKNNLTIVKNTGYLSIIECIRLALPFIAIPYLIKTVGADLYGLVVWVQTIISYFTIFINFGLDISAVKDVSENRNNKDELNRIVTAVLSLKLIFFIISAILLSLSVCFFSSVYEHQRLFLFAFLTCMFEIMFPVWFYQGIEKMKFLTIIRSLSIVIYVSMIFVFVRGKGDYEYIALLQSLGNIVAGIVSLWLLFAVNKIRISRISRKYLKKKFTDSIPFFISRLSDVFNSTLAKTICGIIFPMSTVAVFDLAQKIGQAALVPIRMFNQAVYPHIARIKNVVSTNKFFKFDLLLSFSIFAVIQISAPVLVKVLSGGVELLGAVEVVRILSFWVLFAGVSSFTGAPVLVSFGYPKSFNRSVIYASLVLSAVYIILYLFNIGTIYTFAVALVLSELYILVYRLYYCSKYNLLGLFRWRK